MILNEKKLKQSYCYTEIILCSLCVRANFFIGTLFSKSHNLNKRIEGCIFVSNGVECEVIKSLPSFVTESSLRDFQGNMKCHQKT